MSRFRAVSFCWIPVHIWKRVDFMLHPAEFLDVRTGVCLEMSKSRENTHYESMQRGSRPTGEESILDRRSNCLSFHTVGVRPHTFGVRPSWNFPGFPARRDMSPRPPTRRRTTGFPLMAEPESVAGANGRGDR